MSSRMAQTQWTFMTSYGAVLLYVANHPRETMRRIAERLGLTERTAARILHHLQEEDYVYVHKEGRRNIYEVNKEKPLKDLAYADHKVEDFLRLLDPEYWIGA